MRKTFKLKSAYSFNNGIMFHSSLSKNYTTIVTIDEKHDIKTEWLPKQDANKLVEDKEMKKRKKREKCKKNVELENKIVGVTYVILMSLLVLPWFLFPDDFFHPLYLYHF